MHRGPARRNRRFDRAAIVVRLGRGALLPEKLDDRRRLHESSHRRTDSGHSVRRSHGIPTPAFGVPDLCCWWEGAVFSHLIRSARLQPGSVAGRGAWYGRPTRMNTNRMVRDARVHGPLTPDQLAKMQPMKGAAREVGRMINDILRSPRSSPGGSKCAKPKSTNSACYDPPGRAARARTRSVTSILKLKTPETLPSKSHAG